MDEKKIWSQKNGAKFRKFKQNDTYFEGTKTIQMVGKLCKLRETVHSGKVNTEFYCIWI
jgi:hypothetical protein